MKNGMNGTNGKNLRDLIGHMVCRTTPIYQNCYRGFGGFALRESNYRYCDLKDAIKVVKVVDGIVLIERKSDKSLDKTESDFVLDTVHPMFDDDNWKVVDEAWNILNHKSVSVLANDFRRLHVVEESFSFGCDQDWHLKDVMYVPVDGEEVAFRVEHISDDKVYFVAVDAVGKSTMKNMNNFLDDYLKKLPENLVRNMCEIEHKVEGNLVRRSKLTLLSRGNISDTNGRCNGIDDILFDGLLTEAERCKNVDGETEWYWLDTPSNSSLASDSTYFMSVYTSGSPYNNSGASNTYAVVPCFSIRKKRKAACEEQTACIGLAFAQPFALCKEGR